MLRLLSNKSGNKLPEKVVHKYEKYAFYETGELELLPNSISEWRNGFYKTSQGKKVFVYDMEVYEGTRYMSAWVFYNFATNLKSRKMNKDQYHIWRCKMDKEGKSWMLYD